MKKFIYTLLFVSIALFGCSTGDSEFDVSYKQLREKMDFFFVKNEQGVNTGRADYKEFRNGIVEIKVAYKKTNRAGWPNAYSDQKERVESIIGSLDKAQNLLYESGYVASGFYGHFLDAKLDHHVFDY